MRSWGLRPIVFGPGTPWRTWGTRPIPSDFAMTQRHNRRAARKSVCTRPVRFSFLARSYYLDRFLGDFLFKVRNKRAAEGGGGTALSKTIASAVISLP
jgi:hypothetical protein